MASALQRLPPKAKVQPPYPLADAPVTSTGDADASEALHPRAEEGGGNNMSRSVRWTVLRLEGKDATAAVYDKLWEALGLRGKRWFSVAKHNGVLRALLLQ